MKKARGKMTAGHFLLILILCTIVFYGVRSILTSDDTNNSATLTSSEPAPSDVVKNEVPLLVNIPALIDQSPRVVDSAIGKPTEVTKVTGNREYVPGEFREYIILGVKSRRTTKDGLMVRFYKGKAIRFTLDLPQPAANAKEALKLAGIDVGERLPDIIAPLAEGWNGIFINGRTCSAKAVRVWIEPSQGQAYDLVQVETEP